MQEKYQRGMIPGLQWSTKAASTSGPENSHYLQPYKKGEFTKVALTRLEQKDRGMLCFQSASISYLKLRTIFRKNLGNFTNFQVRDKNKT